MRTIVYDFSTSMKKPYHNSEETASQPCTIVINKLLVGERAVLCGKKTSHLHKKKQHASKVSYILAWHLLTYCKMRYNKQLESTMQACKQNVW